MKRIVLLVLLVGCYREKPDDATAQRIAKIEQRLDAQDKAIAEARSHDDAVQLAALAAQIAELQQQIAALKPPPAPRKKPDKASMYSIPLGPSPVIGSPKAKVTLVMAMDFDCPFCRRAWDTVDDLRKRYGAELRVAYKPLVVHAKNATLPAEAVCAANKQGKFRKLAELLWTKMYDRRAEDPDVFDQAHVDALAKQAGLSMAKYQVDITTTCPAEVRDEMAVFIKIGATATPSFFINGRFMEGARPIAEFVALIDEEMAKATAAIKRGVKPEQYYDQEIVGKGLTEPAGP